VSPTYAREITEAQFGYGMEGLLTQHLSWRAFGGILSYARLQGVTGDVVLDPENEFNDRIRVAIPVSTLVASNRLLTWQLKSDMFFDAEHYPTLTFASARVARQGNDRYRIFGTLTVRNISRPVVLEARAEAPAGKASLALHATTAISRSAYQMDRFSGVVDDRIAIAIDIVAARKASLQPLP
jgi:polyisoprenoid-binding protein YceI